ncbi:uncharacterized protein TNCV_3106921 [Trichonephila clavipes]|nr:uncharacterized protein TNCV_3106921 [Trichonephila clavipes]
MSLSIISITSGIIGYVCGHLTGRALDWFDALDYKVVEEKATDYAQLKHALTEQFPVVWNRSEPETRFYASYHNQKQRPSDFVYELLKIHKKLKLEMEGENHLDNIISRLELQLLDYVEVRHPQTTSSLLQKESNRFGGQGVGDNHRFDSRRRSGQSDQRFNSHGGRQGGSRTGAFRGQNGQDRKTYYLDFLNKDDTHGSSLCSHTFERNVHLSPVGHTRAEKSFISEEVYRRYISYRPRQKTKDRVELQIRIRDFQKTWEFHILDYMQYQCILGIDFMKDSRLTLDFDKKSLVIPDDQIKPLPVVEKPVEIDLSNTKLGERQKGPVVSRPYRYDRVKQGIIDYHIQKMLKEGTIRAIQSPYSSPVVLTRKNNGLPPDSPEAYRFAIDYRKLNAITKYPPDHKYPFYDHYFDSRLKIGLL